MFQIERTVGSSHIGPGRILTLGSTVDFVQDCCGFQMDKERAISDYFLKNPITLFLISQQINLFKPAYYGDTLFIRTSVYSMKASHGFRNTLIYNDKEELLVSSYTGAVFVNTVTGRATTIPKEIASTVAIGTKFEGMDYLPRKISPPKDGGVPCEKMPVYTYYIDENDHVNNARYFDIAGECIPKDFPVKTCRIEYRSAARAGEVMIPVRYNPTADMIIISLTGTAGQVYAHVEFRK